jgi:hypothetical protein
MWPPRGSAREDLARQALDTATMARAWFGGDGSPSTHRRQHRAIAIERAAWNVAGAIDAPSDTRCACDRRHRPRVRADRLRVAGVTAHRWSAAC